MSAEDNTIRLKITIPMIAPEGSEPVSMRIPTKNDVFWAALVMLEAQHVTRIVAEKARTEGQEIGAIQDIDKIEDRNLKFAVVSLKNSQEGLDIVMQHLIRQEELELGALERVAKEIWERAQTGLTSGALKKAPNDLMHLLPLPGQESKL